MISRQRHYNHTTQCQMQYATSKYNQNEKKQCTCDYIDSETENAKNNSEYISDQVNQTAQTNGPITIHQPTKKEKKIIPNTTHCIRNTTARTATK